MAAAFCAAVMPAGQTTACRGDDGVTGEQEGVVAIDQRGVDRGQQNAGDVFGAVSGDRIKALQLAGGRYAADYGAEFQVLAGGDGDLLAGIVEVGRLVLQEIAEIEAFGDGGHGLLLSR